MEIRLNDEVLHIFMLMRLISLCLVFMIAAPINTAGQGEWELKREKKGIAIYVREQENNPLKEYRAQAKISQPLTKVIRFLTDIDRHPEWVFRCTGLSILKSHSTNQVWYHTTYDIPWPMKDRDLTAKASSRQNPDGSSFEMLTTNILVDYPLADGVIRMPAYREWVVLEKINSGNTLFSVEGYADPGGKVPPWLVNMFLVDGIYDSVEKAREILMNEENQ